MLLLPQLVITKWNPTNQDWLKSKGYAYEWRGEVSVYVLDLPPKSSAYIEYYCDYCGSLNTKKYHKLLNGREYIEKDCCNKGSCKNLKLVETMTIKYGVEHCMDLDSTKIKIKETMMERYGVEQPLQLNKFKEKAKNTTKERYGKEYYMQTEEYKERAKVTNLERYGTEWTFQSEEIKNLIKENNMRNYGVEFVTQREEIKEKIKETNLKKFGHISNLHNPEIRIKILNGWDIKYGGLPMRNENVKNKLYSTLNINGTAPCSKQQKYLHKLYGGELNYPIGNYLADIALVDEKIIIEYDGGGHDLAVKLDYISFDDFKLKEISRENYFIENGWKVTRIITSIDKLPKESVLIELIELIRNFHLEGNDKICLYLELGIIECGDMYINYDFGDLNRLPNIKRKVI